MTAWVLCLNPSTARLRTNDDKSPLSDVTDAWHLSAFDDEVTNDGKEVIREPSRDDTVADEFKPLMLEKKGGEPSCVKKQVRKWVPCASGFKTIATCREYSLTTCYSAIPQHDYKKCQPIYSHFPGCKHFHITDCQCAMRNL